jgi:hypothetical protein
MLVRLSGKTLAFHEIGTWFKSLSGDWLYCSKEAGFLGSLSHQNTRTFWFLSLSVLPIVRIGTVFILNLAPEDDACRTKGLIYVEYPPTPWCSIWYSSRISWFSSVPLEFWDSIANYGCFLLNHHLNCLLVTHFKAYKFTVDKTLLYIVVYSFKC